MIKLLVCCPIKADATSFYRGWGPLNHLSHYFGIELININTPGQEITWDLITQGDVIFLQRPSTYLEVKVMEAAQHCGIPCWIDYDDDYLNIPETNPRHNLYANAHRVECIRKAIEYAAVITTSTPSIKNTIIQHTGKRKDSIHVIPNGVDEQLFYCKVPSTEDLTFQRDIILWRGGDTHGADIDPFIDKMVALYEQFPKYKWAFMGHTHDSFLKRIDNDRVLLYRWDDVTVYLNQLFELRPKITVVPWIENAFNSGKSNCSWLESTLAGAATVFPEFSTEAVRGMVTYTDPNDFYVKTAGLMEGFPEFHVKESFETLQEYTLGKLNLKRNEILNKLVSKKSRLGFRNGKYLEGVDAYSDKQVYDYTHFHQFNQDHESYKKAHYEGAQKLLDKFKPLSIIEFGCGPGPMLEYFLDYKVPQVKGFDMNPYFKQYFDDRNPHYGEHFILADFTDISLDGVFDLGISIESFEHLPEEKIEPLLAQLADHFKYFYFTSTPYRTSIKFDTAWGHQSVKTHEKWIMLFEKNGWKYEENPQIITKYDHVFSSVNNKQ